MTVPSNVGVYSFLHSLASSSPNSPSSAFSNSTHYGAFKPVAPKASALPPPNFAARRASMGAQAQLQALPSSLALAPLHHRQEKAPQSVVHEELYEDEVPYEQEQSYNEIQQQQQQRVLGGGCWESQGEPMVAASSPWSDRSEYESDELEEYEEEESFDGPLKDQYRGRAWSQGQEQQQPIGVGRTGGWSEPPASEVAYDSRRTSNASMFDQQQHQQQQQSNHYQQQQYQQQQAPPPAPSRDLDRLFHGLRLPVPNQQQQASYQPQVVVPQVVKAPVLPPPAPTAASSLVLAPFLTEAVWSLLQNPFASHASDRDSAAVVSDGQGYERVSGGDFGGRDEYWPVTPPTARNGGVSQGGWRNVKAAAWEDERWSNDPYSPHSNQLQTPPALTLDDFSSSPYQPAPPALRRNPYMLSTSAPPTSFTRFAHQTLAQTLIQPTGVMLALWYISRSPIHEGGGEEGRKFRDALRNCGDGATGEEIAKRVLTLGLAWANKWLEDNTYTNRSWSDVTRIPIAEINNLELLALSTMSFDLSVSVTEWATWINRLYTSTDDSVVRSALVQMSDSLASAEHKRSFEPRGRDYKNVQASQNVSAVEAMDVSPVRNVETPVRPAVVVAPSTWGTGYSSSSSSMNSTASSIPRKSLSSTSHTNIWGEFGQQQRSSSITGYNHLHHPQQQRHSLAQSYNNGSYASSRSSRASMSSYYNASAARGNGVTLPSVQQGFGTRGWEMMGTGGGMVPMAQTTTCW